MSDVQVSSTDASAGAKQWSDRWTWLGRHLEWLRPGLRAATEADQVRLRQSPSVVALVLPWAAIVVPLVFSIGTAATPRWFQATPYDQFAFLIYDVFTESTPFMLAGLAIGLASPAAGILFVLSYAIGNLAATVITGELDPPLSAAIGRLASFALLWLLVVEIPLLARWAVESFGARSGAGKSGRLVAVGAGALVVTGLTWVWVLFAPISIQTVFWLASPGAPFLRPVWTLLYYPLVVIIPAGVMAAFILGARYLGSAAPAAADVAEDDRAAPVRQWLPYLSALALAGLLLLGVLQQPLDAVILFAAIVGVPPLARLVLRRSRLAPLLVRIPGPVRLIAGAVVSYPLSLGFLSIVGPSDVSRWFNTLFALVMSFFIIELLLEADALIPAAAIDSAAASDDAAGPTIPTVPPVVAGLFALMTLMSLALPVAVLAHGGSGETDGDATLAAGAAVGGAGLGAAAGANRRNDTKPIPKPKPPPPVPPNPWDRKPKGPPLDPYGKPKKKPPPDPPSDFDFWSPSTWFK
jgi:hypothetical protein